MICSLCHKTFSDRDLNKFVIHLEYAHCMKHRYECPICKRTFNRRDNFKTHLKTHYSTIDPHEQNLGLKNVEVISDQVHDNVVKGDVTGKADGNFIFDMYSKTREFMGILKQSTLKLIASLHNEISIPRSFIQKVVDMFKQFLNSGFLDTLKDFLFVSNNSSHLNSKGFDRLFFNLL